jgi:hypothetical protein
VLVPRRASRGARRVGSATRQAQDTKETPAACTTGVPVAWRNASASEARHLRTSQRLPRRSSG